MWFFCYKFDFCFKKLGFCFAILVFVDALGRVHYNEKIVIIYTGFFKVEKFHIVSALCRQVVKDGTSKEVMSQMDRLHEALLEDGLTDEARVIKRHKADKTKMIEPSKVNLSRVSHLKGQVLTPNSKVPVDKDSGSPLARVIFPDELVNQEQPIFPVELSGAIEQLVNEWANIDKLEKFGVKPSLSCLLFYAWFWKDTACSVHCKNARATSCIS